MPNIIYMDHHATTPVDPRVVEVVSQAMLTTYGNAGSTSHTLGWEARDAVEEAREFIAAAIGAIDREIVFTSGATESNNLALRGVVERATNRRRRGQGAKRTGPDRPLHIVTVSTEHKAVLDPLAKMARAGVDVTYLTPQQNGAPDAGRIDVQQVQEALRDDTLLVSVMLANNEIGVLQPVAEIAELTRERGVLLHCDATQAVGKIPVDVGTLGVDLMSFSAHKMYGPKGVGALYVRRSPPHVRLAAQIDGGGQEFGLRSGTLNVPGIVGFAAALKLCIEEMPDEAARLSVLRDTLHEQLTTQLDATTLNGPQLNNDLRLAANLNLSFANVDGEALMLGMKQIAVSSGSACTSANPEPSHVLRAIGLSEDQTRSSLRFSLGRFNTAEHVTFAADLVIETVERLRKLGSAG